MAMVFFVAEDQTGFLEELNNWMRLAVDHMGPFVDLICEDAQDHSKNNSPGVGLPNGVVRDDPQSDSNK